MSPELVGIEGIVVEIPYNYVDLEELEQLDQQLNKYTKGLRMKTLAVPDPNESVCQLAEQTLLKLFKVYNVHPCEIGRLEVATESMIDKSKSIKSSLMKHFQGNTDVEGVDVYHACYAGTSALFSAIEWIKGPWWNGKKAIVICTDIAIWEPDYKFMNGAGAVAVLISSTPKLVIESLRSTSCTNELDFYRPIHSPYPIVNGQQSLNIYIDKLQTCLSRSSGPEIESTDFWIFHSASVLNTIKACKTVCQHLKIDPNQFEHIYNTKVLPSTHWISQSGSLFTAALFTSLANVLYEKKPPIFSRFLLFAFGSGAMATLYTMKLIEPITVYQPWEEQTKNKLTISDWIQTTYFSNKTSS